MEKKILDYKLCYFLGIGGIGMSALARYFNHYKIPCAGYDKTPTALTSQLEKEGIEIHFDENTDYLEHLLAEYEREDVLIVYTPAVPKEHAEYKYLLDKEYEIKKRSEVLGEITKSFRTIAIAGTHGKTTTTTLVTHILKSAGVNCNAFLGGISKNYNTNLILADNPDNKDVFVVVEADEYDRSFLTLHPYAAVITSVDADHLDIYGDYSAIQTAYTLFAQQVKENGYLLVKKNVDNTLNLKNNRYRYSVISVPESGESEFYSKNVSVRNAEFYFDFHSPLGSLKNVHLGIPGKHNVENATAAAAICELLGVKAEKIQQALHSFSGVKRRFDYRVKTKNVIYIDDYAHHPEELKASISAAKDLYPEKKITGIFQPHLFTRTRDFADGFAEALDLLDECILLPVYPAREKPIEGITSEMLLKKMKTHNKRVLSKDEVVPYLRKNAAEVLLTLGAGDIDTLIEPIENLLKE